MNNRTLLTGLLGVSTAASAAAQTPAKVKAPQTRPNIIIIYTDDMGIGDLSCTNTGWIETPAIDRLASQGLVMNNYYSAAPVSSPSRVGSHDGNVPDGMGHQHIPSGPQGQCRLRAGRLSLSRRAFDGPGILHDAGYATGHFGKWHMGGGRDVTDAPQITRYGFDEYCSTWESPDPAPELTASNWIWCKKDDVKRWERTGYFIDKTLDFLVRHQGTPCFVNLWPDDMHTPWVPDEESQDHNNTWGSRPNFTEVLAEYDRQIGRFLTRLDELGLSDNTIVIFTSDNGPGAEFPPAPHQQSARHQKQPLRRRHPHALHHPLAGRHHAGQGGRRDRRLRRGSAALALRHRPAPLPKDYRSSGEDMSKALLGKASARKGDLMWDFGRNASFNFPRDAYHRSPSLAIRRGDWKLLVNPDGTNAELYDLSKDANETQNLAAEHPGLTEELSKSLLAWWERRPRINGQKEVK